MKDKKKKDPRAVGLGKQRWVGATKEELSDHGKMMAKARLEKKRLRLALLKGDNSLATN